MKVCLIGSTKFMDQFAAANLAFTLAGHTVYTVAQTLNGDYKPEGEDKVFLDLAHLNKILESDMVILVGLQPDGTMYIGESTRREIMWAHIQLKSVGFWDTTFNWEDLKGPRDEYLKTDSYAKTTEVERKVQLEERKKKIEEHFSNMHVIPLGEVDSKEDKPKVN